MLSKEQTKNLVYDSTDSPLVALIPGSRIATIEGLYLFCRQPVMGVPKRAGMGMSTAPKQKGFFDAGIYKEV